MNAIHSSASNFTYVGPKQRLELVDGEDRSRVLQDDRELYLGEEPVGYHELTLASFFLSNQRHLNTLDLDFSGAEIVPQLPGCSLLNSYKKGGTLQLVDSEGSRQNVDRVVLEEDAKSPGKVHVYLELGPQGGLPSVLQTPHGALTWE